MTKMQGANTSELYIFKAYDYNFWSTLYKLFTSSVKILAFIWELFKFFLSGKNYHISFPEKLPKFSLQNVSFDQNV